MLQENSIEEYLQQTQVPDASRGGNCNNTTTQNQHSLMDDKIVGTQTDRQTEWVEWMTEVREWASELSDLHGSVCPRLFDRGPES